MEITFDLRWPSMPLSSLFADFAALLHSPQFHDIISDTKHINTTPFDGSPAEQSRTTPFLNYASKTLILHKPCKVSLPAFRKGVHSSHFSSLGCYLLSTFVFGALLIRSPLVLADIVDKHSKTYLRHF